MDTAISDIIRIMNKNVAFKLGHFYGRSNCFKSKLVHWVRQYIAWLVSIMLGGLHNSFSKRNFTLDPIHKHSCCDISFCQLLPYENMDSTTSALSKCFFCLFIFFSWHPPSSCYRLAFLHSFLVLIWASFTSLSKAC